jgi:hypothetical protein
VKTYLFIIVGFIDVVRPAPVGEDTGSQITWSTSDGAILHLPCGASRLTCSADSFRSQAIKHAHSWYKFANVQQRRRISDGSLYLITGTDKTNAWMVGAFSGAPPGNQVSLGLRLAGAVEETTFYDYSWVSAPAPEHRTGPRSRRVNPSQTDLADTFRDDQIFLEDAPDGQNQCVFLRGYRIMLNRTESALGEALSNVDALSITDTTHDDIPAAASNIPYSETSPSTTKTSGEGTELGRGNVRSSQYLPVKRQDQDVVLEPILEHQEVSFPRITSCAY